MKERVHILDDLDAHLAEQLQDPEFRAEWYAQEISHVLANLRIKRGLTQKELAIRVGKQQPAIARFERGGRNTTVFFLRDLCEALGARLEIRIVPDEVKEIDIDRMRI